MRRNAGLESTTTRAVATLSAWSNHINVRDKSVKTLQYASRIVWGYHANSFSPDRLAELRNVSFLCSMARKVFRLGKSINCLNDLVNKLTRGNVMLGDRPPRNLKELNFCLELLEQVFLALFMLYDHMLFFGRAKILLNYDGALWESRNYCVWFLYDATGLCRRVLQLFDCSRELHQLDSSQSELDRLAMSSDLHPQQQETRRRELQKQLQQVCWDLVKSCCDVSVSGGFFANTVAGKQLLQDWVPFLRRVVPSDGAIGVMGTASAVMAVIESGRSITLESTS